MITKEQAVEIIENINEQAHRDACSEWEASEE